MEKGVVIYAQDDMFKSPNRLSDKDRKTLQFIKHLSELGYSRPVVGGLHDECEIEIGKASFQKESESFFGTRANHLKRIKSLPRLFGACSSGSSNTAVSVSTITPFDEESGKLLTDDETYIIRASRWVLTGDVSDLSLQLKEAKAWGSPIDESFDRLVAKVLAQRGECDCPDCEYLKQRLNKNQGLVNAD